MPIPPRLLYDLGMLSIAVCDDELAVCAQLQCALAEILDREKVRHKIDLRDSAEKLCRSLEAGARYDLIFIDIGFAENEIDGVQAGLRIREAYGNNAVFIVYVSWEKAHAFDLIDARPVRFLLKPLERGEIEKTVRTFMDLAGHSQALFGWKKGQDAYSAPIRDIAYLENKKRKVIIHFSDGRRDEFYGSLQEQYDAALRERDFLFIHASYLVNYDFVEALRHDRLTVSGGGESLPISRDRSGGVKERYLAITSRRRAM